MGSDPFSSDPAAKIFLAFITVISILNVLKEEWVIWILSYGRKGPQDVNQFALRTNRAISAFVAIYGVLYILWNFISK